MSFVIYDWLNFETSAWNILRCIEFILKNYETLGEILSLKEDNHAIQFNLS